MLNFEQLEQSWAQVPSPPKRGGRVESIVIRLADERRETPREVQLSPENGLHGDRWSAGESPNPDAQVSLMNIRIGELIADGQPLERFGDNLLVDFDLGEDILPIGATMRIGTAVIQVSPKLHKGCKKYKERFGADALRWVNHKGNKMRRFRGLYCRVLEAGTIQIGDVIDVIPPTQTVTS